MPTRQAYFCLFLLQGKDKKKKKKKKTRAQSFVRTRTGSRVVGFLFAKDGLITCRPWNM